MARECPHCGGSFRWPLKPIVGEREVEICPRCRRPLDAETGDIEPIGGPIAALPPPAPDDRLEDDVGERHYALPPEAVSAESPKPLGQRALVAELMVAVVGVTALGSLWADLGQLDLLNRAIDGERITLAEAQRSDDRVSVAAIVYLVALIVSMVTFLLWYSRAYRNTIALGVARPRYKPRWAVAYWFIPIANLFRPKQVVNDIWRGSDPNLPERPVYVADRPVTPLLHWWWFFWVLSIFAANVATRTTRADFPAPDELRREATAYVVADVADVVAAVLCILVIRAVTQRQNQRLNVVGARSASEPAPPVAAGIEPVPKPEAG